MIFLFGAFPVDSKERISFGGFSAVYAIICYIAPWPGMLQFQLINKTDR